jgi:hypothetical protein
LDAPPVHPLRLGETGLPSAACSGSNCACRQGKRLTFGKAGEATLSQWMAENARVCWLEHTEPWALESELFSQLDLPLTLDQNRHNAFHDHLKELRAQARQQASAARQRIARRTDITS